MNFNLPQTYVSKLLRAVTEFSMIEESDRILIGLSGGKDSLFLLCAAALLRRRLKVNFSLAALTVDPLFSDNFPMEILADYCRSLKIPFDGVAVDIKGAIKSAGKNPCFTCAYFRRAAINRYACEHGFNKIAYAHHNDDAVETFFMSLLYSGQLNVFTPTTYLDRTKLTVIRPLIYLREAEIAAALPWHGFKPIKSPCPNDGHTKRQEIKETIAELGKKNPALYHHLAAAMRQSALGELWPTAKTKAEMRENYLRLMSAHSARS